MSMRVLGYDGGPWGVRFGAVEITARLKTS